MFFSLVGVVAYLTAYVETHTEERRVHAGVCAGGCMRVHACVCMHVCLQTAASTLFLWSFITNYSTVKTVYLIMLLWCFPLQFGTDDCCNGDKLQ